MVITAKMRTMMNGEELGAKLPSRTTFSSNKIMTLISIVIRLI